MGFVQAEKFENWSKHSDYFSVTVSAVFNKPRSMYQHSNMAPRLSGQTYVSIWCRFLCIQVSFEN